MDDTACAAAVDRVRRLFDAGVSDSEAIRVSVASSDASLREEVRAQAQRLGLHGWVRLIGDGTTSAHVEGPRSAVQDLVAWLRARADLASLSARGVRVEGHEQFAIRGIAAGVFVVQEHQATAHHFDLRLEVDGAMRSWAVPKGPSMDPTIKRLAVQVDDHELAHNDFEGRTGGGGVIVWDRGTYEQGGRVPWPEALARGHAVFVLHGEKLRGGFALQRTGGGAKPGWLLIKRRDEYAERGSEVTVERPESVRSGMTLVELLGRAR